MNPHSVIQSMQPLASIRTALDVRALKDAKKSEKEIEEAVRCVRDQVFHFRQTAEALVSKADRSPRLCAGAMVLIARRMLYSRVSYELFTALDAKEYVVEATNYIHNHTSVLLKMLPDYEITEVLEMAEAFEQTQDLKYFIEHYDTVAQYDILRAQVHDKNTQYIVFASVGIAAVALAALSWVLSPVVTVLWLVVGAAIAGYYSSWQQGVAQRVTRMTAACCDIPRVMALARRYKNTIIAKYELESVQRVVQAFFGDMSPNSHLTGIFSIIQMQINM